MKKDISYYISYFFFFGLILALVGLALNDRPIGLWLMWIGAVCLIVSKPRRTMSDVKKDMERKNRK